MQQNNIDETLQRYFGFRAFNPGQRAVIEQLLAGHSALAIFPTGGGKSLCYQLPALLLPGLTLVVSPLIALMKDQIDALQQRGIAAARLDSSLSADEYREVFNQARSGALKMLYVAPERFNNERFRATIAGLPIALLAIDEAHCISEWGHNFRPDYLKLPEYAQSFAAERVLALTATATRAVEDDICRAFSIQSDCAIRTGFYRPNLTLLSSAVSAGERDATLLARIRSRASGPVIVYVTLQRTAEEVAARLAEAGFSARPYHAGMKNELRAETQEWFMQADDAIVVATIAFGMGVDKSNIRYVYHYNLAKSLENYAQEIGRAGRDGEPSICEMLVCMDDLNVLENFIYGDTPTQAALQSLLDDLFSQEEDFDISQYELSNQHDIRPLVLRTLLTYLELDGYLAGGTPFYANYQFKPLQSSAEILARFDEERRTFLGNLFRLAQKARTWFTIDVQQAAVQLSTQRERIIRALDYLAEQNLLEVKVSGIRNRYRRLKRPDSNAALAEALFQRACKREAAEIARLQQVLDFASMQRCQVNGLAAHFDDQRSEPCGHCTWCLHQQSATLAERHSREIDSDIWNQAIALRRETPQLHDPVALVRFLCGISSPKLSQSKLAYHPLFGSMVDVPFKMVLSHVRPEGK